LRRKGKVVGVLLVRNFVYTDEQARDIAVHPRGLPEALRRVYDADGLVRELTGGD
jgi:hypothetical protein